MKIRKLMLARDGKSLELAKRLNRSVSYARNVINGWLPSRQADAEFCVETVASYLGVKPEEILVGSGKKRSA